MRPRSDSPCTSALLVLVLAISAACEPPSSLPPTKDDVSVEIEDLPAASDGPLEVRLFGPHGTQAPYSLLSLGFRSGAGYVTVWLTSTAIDPFSAYALASPATDWQASYVLLTTDAGTFKSNSGTATLSREGDVARGVFEATLRTDDGRERQLRGSFQGRFTASCWNEDGFITEEQIAAFAADGLFDSEFCKELRELRP